MRASSAVDAVLGDTPICLAISRTLSNASTLSDEQVKSLTLHITDAICSHGDTQSLISDYDLSMSYREVEIDSISFDDGNVEDVVKEGINEWINNNTNN